VIWRARRSPTTGEPEYGPLIGWCVLPQPSADKQSSMCTVQGAVHVPGTTSAWLPRPRSCCRAWLQPRIAFGAVILTRSNGRPWDEANDLGSRFSEAKIAAGIKDLTFNDLRGTAVTRLSEAEATPQQIRPITGHSLESIHRIIERYCARTDKLAGGAILKLERSRG
jgi:hypothetical protein